MSLEPYPDTEYFHFSAFNALLNRTTRSLYISGVIPDVALILAPRVGLHHESKPSRGLRDIVLDVDVQVVAKFLVVFRGV